MADSPELPVSEFICFPDDNPAFKIPLHGAVELIIDSEDEPAPTTPEERTQAFLATNSPLFEAVDAAWRNVKSCQTGLKELTGGFTDPDTVEGLPRYIRRGPLRAVLDAFDPVNGFASSKAFAMERYPGMIKKYNDDQPLESHHASFINDVHRTIVGRTRKLKDEERKKWDDGKDPYPEEFREHIEANRSLQSALGAAHLYVEFTQDVALRKIASFLEDDEVVPAFIERLQSLATERDFPSFPGLLELVATHMRKENQANILQTALYRSAPPAEVYASEFIANVRARKENMPKELAAAVQVMEIAANVIESEYRGTADDFYRIFAERVHNWPDDMANRLREFANGKLSKKWQETQAAVEPYVRIGRLPTEKSERRIGGKQGSPRQRDQGIPARNTESTGADKTRFTLGRRGQNHSDVIDTQEQEPISSFAILTRKGERAGMQFTLESVDTIEELFAFTNLDTYCEKHAADTTLKTVLVAAIETLQKQPKHPGFTTQLKGVDYILLRDELESLQRSPRRFRPDSLPGVTKGPIARSTRLIYDVLTHEGVPTLVIYGAFIKQDIENMTKMPRIRN